MSKSTIQNITTTQTFQNWFDKTNEMVDLFREQTVTATITGDLTIGNANLQGTFQANTVIADTLLRTDAISAFTGLGSITVNSPIVINGTGDSTVATFAYAASGGQVKFTDNTTDWDVGINNSTNADFIIDSGVGIPKLKLSPAGMLTVNNITVVEELLTEDIVVNGTLTANGAVNATSFAGPVTGNLTGNVISSNTGNTVVDTSGSTTEFIGNLTGYPSALTNLTTSDLAEGTRYYFTPLRARQSLTGGTGITYNEDTGEIKIGQNVSLTSNVGFNTIVTTGDITAFGTVSDRTQKENIVPITNALDKVDQLGGYTFNYKNKPDTPMTGVMAQELLEVLPEAVYKTIDGNTGEEIYAVRHGNVIGLLIEAIKELNEKVGK
jgi:hypothetical protein